MEAKWEPLMKLWNVSWHNIFKLNISRHKKICNMHVSAFVTHSHIQLIHVNPDTSN